MDDGTLFTVIGIMTVAYVATVLVEYVIKVRDFMKNYEKNWETPAVRFITDDDEPEAMECPACGEIDFTEIGRCNVALGLMTEEIIEYECRECGHYGTF